MLISRNTQLRNGLAFITPSKTSVLRLAQSILFSAQGQEPLLALALNANGWHCEQHHDSTETPEGPQPKTIFTGTARAELKQHVHNIMHKP